MSYENLSEFDADVLIVFPDTADQMSVLDAQAGWSRLPAVERGSVVTVPKTTGVPAALAFPSAPSITWATDQLAPEVAEALSGTTTAPVTVRNPNPEGLVPFTFCRAYVVPADAWHGGSDEVLELIGHTLRYPTAAATLIPVLGGEEATYTVDTLAADGWEVVGMCDDVYLPEMNAATEVAPTTGW